MKPKRQYKGDAHKSNGYDRCQTPEYAVEPLLPYLPKAWKIWEPAAGEGYLVRALMGKGYIVKGTDILDGHDFFDFDEVPFGAHAIVTNPPYSVKYPWIEHCYRLDIPWALLMPLETLGAGTAQRMFEQFGVKLILMDKRVDFGMPNIGFNGSAAQFPTAWFCWRLPGLTDDLTYAKLVKRPLGQKSFL